jgi:hypothetical protein
LKRNLRSTSLVAAAAVEAAAAAASEEEEEARLWYEQSVWSRSLVLGCL